MVSINDVAKRAKVSISTVSRVMNKNVNVSQEKQEAVLNAINELDYIPNGLARGLVTKNTNSVGILIADIANMYYSNLVKSIEKTLNNRGYYTIIGNTEWQEEREKDYFRYLIEKQVDGFILASTSLNDKYIDDFSKKKIPMIVLDREVNSQFIDKIRINDYDGAYQATKHLIECNYDYFLHLKGPENVTTAVDRKRAFVQCLSDYNIPVENYKVLPGCFMEECGEKIISDFLNNFELEGRKVGIFAANDATAFGILKELKSRSFEIPRQFGVIGFDDVNFSKYTNPPLTTVSRPIKEVGKIAANTLIERIEKVNKDNYYKKNITLEVKLIKRQTTTKLY